jgi:peptidoglycan/LPS O-acetylase OafA/YrhL
MNTTWPRYIDSLDLLRVFAILLVTLQHAASVTNHYGLTLIGHLSIGQLGVSIFCALSGLLALRDKSLPGPWLLRRLGKLFPAYWIVTLLGFALTWMTRYKPFDAYQFASQMLGLGYLTHGWALVNIVSWFITLILFCYFLTFLAKLSRYSLLVMCSFGSLAIVVLASGAEVVFSRHVIAFTFAAVMGCLAMGQAVGVGVALAAVLLGFAFESIQFVYAGLALLLLSFCLMFPRLTLPGIRVPSSYIYEYFLVHGICLVGAVKLFHGKIGVLVGVGLAVVSAVALKKMVQWLEGACSRV